MRRILFGSVCLLALSGILAAQSSVPLVADISFPFFVGDHQFPAGEYRFLREGVSGLVLVVPKELGCSPAFIMALSADAVVKPKGNFVVFTKYANDKYFLRQIVHAGEITASQTYKSRTERESVTSTLKASNYPERVVILARVR